MRYQKRQNQIDCKYCFIILIYKQAYTLDINNNTKITYIKKNQIF